MVHTPGHAHLLALKFHYTLTDFWLRLKLYRDTAPVLRIKFVTKLRAQNSKKNNFSQSKIDRHLAYIDYKLEEYTRALAENDGDNKKQIEAEINIQEERKAAYRELEKKLKETGEAQISLSDPESRQIMVRNNITEVSYNVQSTVDAKNNIPIDYKVTNENDSKAMGNMVQRAKSILRTNEFTALYDKGFHTGSELKIAHDLGVETIVAIPGVPSTSQAPDPLFNYEFFRYNREDDSFTCPQGKYYTPMDHGIKRKQVQETLSGLSSIKQGHAEIVRLIHNVPGRRKKDSFTEANMLIITKLTGLTLNKRSSSIKSVRR